LVAKLPSFKIKYAAFPIRGKFEFKGYQTLSVVKEGFEDNYSVVKLKRVIAGKLNEFANWPEVDKNCVSEENIKLWKVPKDTPWTVCVSNDSSFDYRWRNYDRTEIDASFFNYNNDKEDL